MANAIFSKCNIEKEFLNMGQKYNATVDKLESANQINNWCRNLPWDGSFYL